jgi:LytS/YehU family sensor histidine kinase
MESHWDDRTKSISMAGITCASFLSLYTIYKQQKGATEIFYGIIACLSCYYYFDITFYIGFSFLVICVLISLSRELKEERKGKAEAVRRSNRLEVELLKKTLQPHFLMNSLSTLMEFIETQPQKSLPFISALASEFDILNEVSALKLIPVTKELELCESYLEIMSFRKDRDYKLEAVDLDGGEQIPPAVFLTILENGIMHNRFDAHPDVVFRISLERSGDQKLYTISIPGKPKAGSVQQKEGTGLKYVKARLEESYGSRFSILSGASASGGWETKISIKC